MTVDETEATAEPINTLSPLTVTQVRDGPLCILWLIVEGELCGGCCVVVLSHFSTPHQFCVFF